MGRMFQTKTICINESVEESNEIQPTMKGPISPPRMARAISLATTRHVDTHPARTAHTMSTICAASPHGMAILASLSSFSP